MKAEPQKEHQWLQRLVGEWTSETEMVMEPGQPAQKFIGTETIRSMGGIWILGEGRGDMPGGGTSETLLTLGYDPLKKSFVGTFIGSMMTNLWVYEGALDAAERVLTLSSDGPNFEVPGKMMKYRDVIELKDDNYRTLTAYMQGDDGQWQHLMTTHYRRKK